MFLRFTLFIPGHYCPSRAETPNPVSESYGDVCTAGHFCPNGTAIPQACPAGTFLNITGVGDETDCTPCTPGMGPHPNPYIYSILHELSLDKNFYEASLGNAIE